MPQTGQKRWRIACLLNRYVEAASSGVFRTRLARGTNQSSEPLREQMEQLQASALSISPWTSNAMRPQWELPVWVDAVVVMVSDVAGSGTAPEQHDDHRSLFSTSGASSSIQSRR